MKQGSIKNIRIFLAALIAPLAAPIFLWLFMLMTKGTLYPGDGLVIGVVAACSYIGFVVLGVPSVLILRRIRKLSLLNVALAGLFVGGTFGQLLPSIAARAPDLAVSYDPMIILVFATFGGIAGVTFGLVAGFRRI